MRCFAHVLNLIVNEGINEVKDSLVHLHEYVKYVRSSPSCLQVFKKCVGEEGIVSKKSLCLDVATRWNTAYLMLSVALDHKKTFERMEEQDTNFMLEFKEWLMCEEDWLTMGSLHDFLENFYTITLRISRSKYVTSNTYFHEVNCIQILLLQWSQSENVFYCDMAIKMSIKFEKYCNTDKVNVVFIAAVVLDPCYKLKYVKFCYSKFYHSTRVDEIIGKVKHFMELFYQQYSSTLLDNASKSVIESSQNSKDVDKGNANVVRIVLNKNKEDWHNFLKNEESVVIRS